MHNKRSTCTLPPFNSSNKKGIRKRRNIHGVGVSFTFISISLMNEWIIFYNLSRLRWQWWWIYEGENPIMPIFRCAKPQNHTKVKSHAVVSWGDKKYNKSYKKISFMKCKKSEYLTVKRVYLINVKALRNHRHRKRARIQANNSPHKQPKWYYSICSRNI